MIKQYLGNSISLNKKPVSNTKNKKFDNIINKNHL